MALGLDGLPLLSDWNAEATRGFGVAHAAGEMVDVPMRSAFLIHGDTVRAAWPLAREMPDIDAVISTASAVALR